MQKNPIYLFRMASVMMMVENNQNVFGWNLEKGYKDPRNKKNYPIQGLNRHFGLLYRTSINNFEYQCCREINQGLKIVLSMPGEAPRISENYFRISHWYKNTIRIAPELTTTTDNLRHFTPNQRKCFYADERRLRFFNMYTGVNCEEECVANFTKIICDCVKFSMPSIT